MTETHKPFLELKRDNIRLLLHNCDVLNESFKCLMTNETNKIFSRADGTLFSPACSSMWFTNRFDIRMSYEFVILVLIAEIAVQIMLSPLLMLFTIFSWIVFSLKIYILYGVNTQFRL